MKIFEIVDASSSRMPKICESDDTYRCVLPTPPCHHRHIDLCVSYIIYIYVICETTHCKKAKNRKKLTKKMYIIYTDSRMSSVGMTLKRHCLNSKRLETFHIYIILSGAL